MNSAVPVLGLLFLSLHASAVAFVGQDAPRPGAFPPAGIVQHVFEEIPGVRELSSRMIARPWPRHHLQAAGMTLRQASSRAAAARREIRQYDLIRHVSSTDEYIIRVPDGFREEAVADRLMATGLFQYVDPDWMVAPVEPSFQIQSTNNLRLGAPGGPICPNDPLFLTQWHHQPAFMDSCAAWGVTTGTPLVSIGLCDTGLRITHEDLQRHRLEGYNAVDMLWESQGGRITSVSSHGTRTTGTAAANGNNALGVAGVGWNLGHRMVRVSNISSGNAYLTDIQHGARTSIESGDRVANVSYHGAYLASNVGTAEYIKSIGGLYVWSAGNTSSGYNHADRDSDDMIVVGATNQSDGLAYFSSFGSFVDLVAPGMGIVTSDSLNDSAYATVEGTSYACPLTSGVCAMIWSAHPNLSPNDVERILKASADDIGAPGIDDLFGYGRINLARALQSDWSEQPVADFAVNPSAGRSPVAVTFQDLSTGIPTSWAWDFGDGGTSTLQCPTHTYLTSGSFDVMLVVSNAIGSDLTVQVGAVLVDVIPPRADFEADVTAGLSPLTVNFSDQSTLGVPTSWFWDLGDGTTSTAANPTHTYTTSGFYTVSMTASNAYGSDTLTRTNYIAVDFIPPVAAFSGNPTSAASPFVVTFTDESTAGVATSWSWSFGDGAVSTLQNPTHTYTVAGTYSVRLTSTNAYGADTLWRTDYIEVLPGPSIVADFVGTPRAGQAPLQVDFTDRSVGNIISWEWNFGDGTTSTLQNPSHTYTSSGEYDVALQVTNALGSDSCLELQQYITVQ